MKDNKVSKKIISILLIALLIITTNVYAAGKGTFQTTLTADKTQVKAGDTVTITMGLSDIAIESGDKGIGGYTGLIKFDSSVLEYVSKTGTAKWESPMYNDGAITATTEDGEVVNTTQSFGTITFKVKEGAKLGETTIELANFSGADGGSDKETSGDIFAANKSIKITVVAKDNNGTGTDNGSGTNNGGSSNSGSQTTNGSTNNQGTTKNTKTDKANIIKNGSLPKAGNNNITMFVVIGVGVVLAIIFYVKFRKIDK